MRLWFKRWVPCPDCVAKGKPSTWYVPPHVSYPGLLMMPGYTNRCFTCHGRGKVRDEVSR